MSATTRVCTVWQGGLPDVFNAKRLEADALRFMKERKWSIPMTERYRREAAEQFGIHPLNVTEFWRVARKLAAQRKRRNERQRQYAAAKREKWRARYARAPKMDGWQ